MRIRLPRLLDGSLRETARLNPVSVSIEDNVTPLSTASMSLPEGETVPLHALIELYTQRGSVGVYRTRSVTQAYTDGASVELEHAACVLGDAIIPGEGTLSGTPAEIAAQLLAHQTIRIAGQVPWTFGESAAGGTITYDYDNTNILAALIELVALLDGYALDFDQSAFPWRVSIVRKETVPSCEGRISRNLRSVSVTLDDSELCTRIYCDKLPEPGYIDGPNASDRGAICKTLSASDDVTLESLTDYIRRYLEDHKDPKVSIEIDADDLSAATGEPLDRFEKGRLFRLALPDYGITLEERILSVHTGSVYGDPENVRLTLANSIRDTAENFVRIDNSIGSGVSQNSTGRYISGRGGGGAGVSQTTVLDMLKKTETYISSDEAWTREAGVKIESNAAGLYATKTSIFGNWTEKPETIDALIQASSDNGGIVSMLVGRKYDGGEISALIAGTAAGGGLITLKANQTTVDSLSNRVSNAEINIDGANAAIALKANQTTVDSLTGRVSTAESTLTVQAGQISSKVSKDGVISTINQSPEAVTISASKINLSGYVTASQLSAVHAQLANLSTGTTQASLLYTQNLTATNTVRLMGHTCGWGTKTVCTGVHYSRELQNVPGGNGVLYAVVSSVKVWGDYEDINYMTY